MLKMNDSRGVVILVSMLVLTACNGAATANPAAGIKAPAPATAAAPARDLSVAPTAVVVGGDAPAVAVDPLVSPLKSPVSAPVIGDAVVDSVALAINASNKSVLDVKIKGSLGDACTALGAITQRDEKGKVLVSVKTSRDPDKVCAQVIKPFETTVIVSMFTLSAGDYVIDVNGVTKKVNLNDKGDVKFLE